ncbi:hypothetical protein L6164_036081 [Bauhinia variegata]|uniref:Uncharacterized protein n=1 Tax=Bauhinia variegata TaxID=167791 RepID=A0ACB9KFV9_BAUVA|nr:hypothetical protein L6164_036081 [Bauhinia variegata]
MGNNRIKSHSLSFFIFFFAVFISIHPCCASNPNVTKLVDDVCAKTSNYSFCVDSLYADPLTPEADKISLVNIAFRLAYENASSTQNHIEELLKNNGGSSQCRQCLERCGSDYQKGLSAIGKGMNDLDSENYDLLPGYADDAARSASDCESSFGGSHSPLTFMNNAFKALSEICIVISNLINNPHK